MYLQVTTLAKITDHTGARLLSQAVNADGNTLQHFQMLSQSLLTWLTIHNPAASCWRLWNTTIRKIFAGSINSNKLTEPLGTWRKTYQTHRYWKWRYLTAHHILHQPTPQQRTRAVLIVTAKQTYWTISAMIPTDLPFDGPPVTPTDMHGCRIDLPISPLPPDPKTTVPYSAMHSIPEQLRATLMRWQTPLIGPIRKFQSATCLCNL